MLMTVAEIRERLLVADETELAALERSLVADSRKGVKQALERARRRIEAERAERKRLTSLYIYERALKGVGGDKVIVGLDEVGRGSLAGPLAVGAVVLPAQPIIEGLNDSKQIRPDRREEIAARIEEVASVSTVCYVSPSDIDRDGMARSLRRAFSGALGQVEALGIVPDVVLVDGNPLHVDEREINVVKGDSKCASIAAASIYAKVHRDRLMREIASRYPGYGFDENKGYSSAAHIEALKRLGLSDVHRRTFCMSFLQESLF